MLHFVQDGSRLRIETEVGLLEWDAARGGQITRFAVKDQKATRTMLANGRALPGLVLTLSDGTTWKLAEATARLEILDRDNDRLKFRAETELGGAVQVELEYDVFADGAVFCNFRLEVAEGRSLTVREAVLENRLQIRGTRNSRWNYTSRYPWVKQDATTVHAFCEPFRNLPMDQRIDLPELVVDVQLDLGWDNTRFYSNRVELLLEDWSAFGEADFYKQTRTRAGLDDGEFALRWDLLTQQPQTVGGGYTYRNRWGLLWAGSRHLCGSGDTARRNNALGARICHCIYPYVQLKPDWPWAVMPIKQVKAQPPMLFKGNPEIARTDEAADLGADTMIIHQFWMANPGSNCEPAADYQPKDPDWLRAFIKHCHQRGMRVLLYGRATEQYHHYASFFEDFCEAGRDGLYLDWSTPFAYGYLKGSLVHVSAYAFYTFHRAMRHRIGTDGILIGHTGAHSQLASNLYDVSLSGEFSVLHEVLLGEPAACACYGVHGGCGGNLLGGGVKDRGIFTSDRAVAFCSALGMSSHCIMSHGAPYDQDSAYTKPLWDVHAALPGGPARVYNPTNQPVDGLNASDESLFPIVYLNAKGQALLIVTNLAAQSINSGSVAVDPKELGITGRKLRPLSFPGVHPCTGQGTSIRFDSLPANKFCAALIE